MACARLMKKSKGYRDMNKETLDEKIDRSGQRVIAEGLPFEGRYWKWQLWELRNGERAHTRLQFVVQVQ